MAANNQALQTWELGSETAEPVTESSTLCAPGYQEVEPRQAPALRQGAAKLPNRQKLLGTPLPSRPKSEGLRGKLGEGTRVHFPVRSAQRLTPSDPPTIRTPYPQLGRHHSPTLGHPKTSSLTRPAGLRRCQSGHPQGWRRFQLHKHWTQPASASGPCATPASRAPGSFSVAGGKS